MGIAMPMGVVPEHYRSTTVALPWNVGTPSYHRQITVAVPWGQGAGWQAFKWATPSPPKP